MKKLTILSVLVAFLLVCCEEQTNPPQDTPQEETTIGFTLDPSVLGMHVGDVVVINLVNQPANTEVLWVSSAPTVATVQEGIVRAIKAGVATITAVAGDESATCKIEVYDEISHLTPLPGMSTLEKGDTVRLKCTDELGLPLTWTSSAEDIATVSADGLVTAIRPGNAAITVSNGMIEGIAYIAVNHHWGEYKEVWREEFDGIALDESIWTIEVNGSGMGNQEAQFYTDREKNLYLKDGALHIQAYKEEYTHNKVTKQYTSGRINSNNKKSFKYGKMEARIMLPAGAGTWPAFWMMGEDIDKVGWPRCGEIDIMEHVGYDPTMVSFAVHTKNRNGTGSFWHETTRKDNIEGEWHTFGIVWEEEADKGRDRIAFTVDGVEYAETLEDLHVAFIPDNNAWPFNKEHYFILNLALGGTLGRDIDDAIFNNPVIMKVDWVRVLQREEQE